jgi:hypothetical protein
MSTTERSTDQAMFPTGTNGWGPLRGVGAGADGRPYQTLQTLGLTIFCPALQA